MWPYGSLGSPLQWRDIRIVWTRCSVKRQERDRFPLKYLLIISCRPPCNDVQQEVVGDAQKCIGEWLQCVRRGGWHPRPVTSVPRGLGVRIRA